MTVDAVAGERTISFRVTNTGPGVPAELTDTVFEPFVTTKPNGPRPRVRTRPVTSDKTSC